MRALQLAVGERAQGFWAAVRDIWPQTREQGDWVPGIGNVLEKLPMRLQMPGKELLREIMYAPAQDHAEQGLNRFENE